MTPAPVALELRVERAVRRWLVAPLLGIARIAIVAICLVTLVDIVGRQLGLPVPGIVELAELALVWAAFAGIAVAFLTGAHVSVELIELLASRRLLAFIEAANALIAFCVICLLMLLGVSEFIDKLDWGDRTMDLGLPQTWYWAAVVVGYAAAVVLVVARAVVLRGRAASQ